MLSRNSSHPKDNSPITVTLSLSAPPLDDATSSSLDIESLMTQIRSDLINALRGQENFVHTYTFGKVVEPTLIISSTFSANSLLPILTPLLQEFSEAKAVVTYNDFSQQLLDSNSQFRNNKRGINVLLFRFNDLYNKQQDMEAFQSNLSNLCDQITQYTATSEAPLILCACSQQYPTQWQAIEEAFLKNILEKRLAYVIRDHDFLVHHPMSDLYDKFGEKEAHLPYTLDYFQALGRMIARIYYTLSTSPKKVIILDCDDTLWKGKVGEDGIQGIIIDEPRKYLQKFLVEKSKQGFLLCLCSRNNEDAVWAMFDREDMILKKEHIADWRINWGAKSENIRSLSNSLNLALNSFIFIDDEPAQIGEVHMSCPEVLSLQLPKQDTLIPIFIDSIWGLEDFGKHREQISDTRTKHYQNNAKRNALKNKASSFRDYLKQLNLQTTIRSITVSDYPRVAELMQRSNQFNFNKWSTEQCTEGHLQNLINNERYNCLVVDVADRYDNYGLVGAMLYHSVNNFLLIEAFVLSCRALSKGVEHRMLKEFCKFVENKQSDVYILFKATQNNRPAATFLEQTGFKQQKMQGREIIYSLPVAVASELNPIEWEQTEKSKLEDISTPINLNIVDQNEFVKHVLEKTINYCTDKQANSTLAFFPVLNSVEGIMEYIKDFGKCIGHPIDGESSLTELGFDSTLAVHFVSRVHKDLGIHLQYIDILKTDCNLRNIATRIYEKISNRKSIPILFKRNGTEQFPLSREQQRLWNFYRQDPNSSKYNMSITYQLQGNLNLSALQSAFRHLLQDETIFCTVFAGDLHQPTQHINPAKSSNFQWNFEDGQNLTLGQLEQKVQQFIKQPFSLEQDLLLRVQLFRVEDQKCILTICVPHIIHDAVSLNLVMKRIAEYYSAFSCGENIKNESRYQYNDYVSWQQSESSEVMENHRAYWQNQLSGLSNSNLPIMEKKVSAQKSKRHCFSLEQTTTRELEQIAGQSKATVYQVLFTIFSILLSKYTGQLDTLILTPTSGRQHPNTNQMIGFFVNILLISAHLKEDYNFFQSVSEIRKVIFNGLQHQDYPFMDVLSFLENLETVSLPISFVFQNYETVSLPLINIECTRIFSDNNSLLYDMASETRLGPLTMYMGKEGDQLSGLIEYDAALFTEQAIQQFILHFKNLLSKIIADPNKPVLNHSLLTAAESEQILQQWNHNKDSIQNFENILAIFQYQVNKNPNSIAVRSVDGELSYAELDKKSTQLSAYLKQRLSLANEDRIAICFPRNVYEAIAILAILKAGCAYVPINPNDPAKRIQYILHDTEAKAILMTQKQLMSFDFVQNKKIVIDNEALFNEPIINIACEPIKRNQLVYIMYTSGSTGYPKGVLIEQQSIVRLVVSPSYIKFNSEDKIPQLSNASFDAATFEFWGGLLNGATLVYPGQNVLADLDEFSKFLSNYEITVLWITAALFEQFAFLRPAIFKNLNYLLSGGDTLNPKAVAAILNCKEGKPKHLLNGYGPTENTTFSTVYEIKDCNQDETIPIGSAIQQTEIYVLDAQQEPVPIGVPGFLFVGGDGLARGYLNQLELTKKKFLEIRISNVQKRLYHTGDVVYWRPDGTLGYIGRADNQVKLRGYRIDIGEIEQKLLAHSAIKQAVVVVRSGELSKNQQKLVAYFVTYDLEHKLNSAELHSFLKEVLPNYMLPVAFAQMDQLPVTTNGKIDRAALSKLEIVFDIENTEPKYKPDTETEKHLTDLIIDTLGLSQGITIEPSHQLLDIGIDSINLIRLSQKIMEHFAVQLSASSIWGMSNIQQIAKLIDEKQASQTAMVITENNVDSLVEIQPGNPKKPFPIIFIHPAGGTTHCYRELMAKFDKDQPCYVIEDVSLIHKKVLWQNIPEIAAGYLQLIKQQKPDWHQIIMGGWSFGGMVAAEMALQNSKEKTGKLDIKSIVLLDTWVVSELAVEAKKVLENKVIDHYCDTHKNKVEPYIVDIFTTRQKQGFSYKPSQVIETPLFLCKAKNANAIINMVDDKNYWTKFAKSIEVRIVNGDHDTMLQDQYAQGLSEEITNHVKTIQPPTPPSQKKSFFWLTGRKENHLPTNSNFDLGSDLLKSCDSTNDGKIEEVTRSVELYQAQGESPDKYKATGSL
jgi:amino acid adenylation domain-containing protein/FkbH-like protein